MTNEKDAPLAGLTDAEVAERVADGRTNANTDVRTKSVRQILVEHTLTLFNGVNLALALLVLVTGQYRNMLFMCVVGANLLIGVVQEVRAKRMVDRLTILTQKEVTVVRASGERAVAPSELVADDLMRLAHGDQVPADAVIVSGFVSMNESLLTGESTPVSKGPGDELLSGSFVDSGSLVARVTRVGAEGYAARINAEAKYVKAVRSEIQDTRSEAVTSCMPSDEAIDHSESPSRTTSSCSGSCEMARSRACATRASVATLTAHSASATMTPSATKASDCFGVRRPEARPC